MMRRLPQRGLFNAAKARAKLAQAHKPDDDAFHHEYSIRPDTYAFKVDATNERTRLLAKRQLAPETSEGVGFKPHPLQGVSDSDKFNLIEFIYRYLTNYPFGNRLPQEEYMRYPTTTLDKLKRFRTRPKSTKMLVSDFIEDSLYNPHYGYFSREVEIFHTEKPFDYNNIEDIDEFMAQWEGAYAKYDQQGPPPQWTETFDAKSQSTQKPGDKLSSKFVQRALQIQKQDEATAQKRQSRRLLQLWHTPTELFSPYYGEALARYLLWHYQTNGLYPYHDLVIYEMGAGNGTLMCNVLNYIKQNAPEIYARTQYRIIEISLQLAEKQMAHALKAKLFQQGLDLLKLQIENVSIFDWKTVVEHPVYFVALEVFDNFAHDLIRYDITTGEPYEGQVLIDGHGDFYEFFTPQLLHWSQAFLGLRELSDVGLLKQVDTLKGKLAAAKLMVPFMEKQHIHPLLQLPTMLGLKNLMFPFKDNMTPGEFIPTRLLQFFQILKHKFPQHHLLCLDFNQLPNTVPGYYNGPVVQTVLQDKMIDVSTYMVMQGYFDIMFGTDFTLAQRLYQQVCGKPAKVETHREFLAQWANLDSTTTKTGDNPMLDFYTNVLFMSS